MAPTASSRTRSSSHTDSDTSASSSSSAPQAIKARARPTAVPAGKKASQLRPTSSQSVKKPLLDSSSDESSTSGSDAASVKARKGKLNRGATSEKASKESAKVATAGADEEALLGGASTPKKLPISSRCPIRVYLLIAFILCLLVAGGFLAVKAFSVKSLPSPTTSSLPPSLPTSSGSLASSTGSFLSLPGAPSLSLASASSSVTLPTSTVVVPPSATLNPSTNTSCAAIYTSSDVVLGPGLNSFPMSPKPTSFVTRKNSTLYVDGEVFKLTGPNVYWLGLDENVIPKYSYPSKGRVREAMAISVAMGATTIRAHSLGISYGYNYSIMPNLSQPLNPAAIEAVDYAIAAAGEYSLRLIIALGDQYSYYMGGKLTFLQWSGLTANDTMHFYNDTKVIKNFKGYITDLLNHKNQYTNITYKNDPTILAWETGNEWGAWMLKDLPPPANWTRTIAQHIKSLAPKHLVIDGTDGLYDVNGTMLATGFEVDEVDFLTDHLYPASASLLKKDQAAMANATSQKAFFIGELDWVGEKGGDNLTDYYAALEAYPNAGSMMWSVFGHDDDCCNYVSHNDGYTLEYPMGNITRYPQALALVQHWYRMRNMTVPGTLPAVACPQPELNVITGRT